MSDEAGGAPKVYIRTFGCQMNVYDSDRMADLLHEAGGYEATDDVEAADLILFNTCSVREKAQEKVFSDLGRVKHLKARGALIGVGGCVASQEGAAIVARAPYVDLVFGPQTLHRLPEMLKRRRSEARPQVDISFPAIEKFDALPPARVDGPTAFVSIMEGCSKYCSYCVVPYTRGEEVSRPFEDVLAEIAGLADQGVREVTLLGQNVNAYRGAMGGVAGACDFAALLEVVAGIDGIERIRYTTSHPKEFSQRLVDLYARTAKLVDHVHLPVQHGSDRMLAAMKRGYTSLEFKSTVKKLRAVRPGIAISSDFIVGFPGETAGRFRALARPRRRDRLRPQLQLRLQRPPRHAGGRLAARRDPGRGRSWPVCRCCRPASRRAATRSASAWSAAFARCWSKARRAATAASGWGAPSATGSSISKMPNGRVGELADVRIDAVRGHSLRGTPVVAVAGLDRPRRRAPEQRGRCRGQHHRAHR